MSLDNLLAGLQEFANDFDADSSDEVAQEIAATHGLVPSTATVALAPALWGPLAFDVALSPDDLEGILKTYDITLDQFTQLTLNQGFKDRLDGAALQVKTLGPTAGFVLNAQSQAEKLINTLGDIAKDTTAHVAVRVKAIENIVRYAHLDPSIQRASKESGERSTAAPGVLVQLNFGGQLGKLINRTIEVNPNANAEDV